MACGRGAMGPPRHVGSGTETESRGGRLGCLPELVEALHNALAAIDDTQSAECVALELRVALQALGEIVGIVTNEDILDQIFREFCIGK